MRIAAAVLLAATLLWGACANAPVKRDAADPQLLVEGTRLMAAGQYGQAVALLQPLVPDYPRDAQLLTLLGECYWRTGDHTAALTHFESSLRIDYGDYRTHLLLAQMLMEQGKSGRALTEFQLAAEYGGHDAVTFYNYGLALYKLGRRDAALEQWRNAYRLEGDNPLYAEAMGMAYTGIDDGEALGFFEKAAELGKNDHRFLHNFGLLLDRLGELRRAEDKYRAALEQAPGDDEYRFSLAALYMKLAAYDQALPHWDTLAAREPGNRAWRTYQAKSLLELERYGDAVAALEAVLPAWEEEGDAGMASGGAPPLDQALDIVAMAYRGSERLEPALRAIEQAVALAPESVAHLINYGVILAESGMIARAIEQWERVLELDPENEAARRNLSAHKQNR